MKRKHFLVVLFLILAIFLSGCGIITDEEKVRNVIDEYFLAINDQDWDKAKSYCIIVYMNQMFITKLAFWKMKLMIYLNLLIL